MLEKPLCQKTQMFFSSVTGAGWRKVGGVEDGNGGFGG